MIRPAFIEIVLFLAPFALYALFLLATRADVLHIKSWPLPRVWVMAIMALTLILASFLYFAHFSGAPPGAVYVPAHMENGKLVPGATQ